MAAPDDEHAAEAKARNVSRASGRRRPNQNAQDNAHARDRGDGDKRLPLPPKSRVPPWQNAARVCHFVTCKRLIFRRLERKRRFRQTVPSVAGPYADPYDAPLL
jgi:hypothetical protein